LTSAIRKVHDFLTVGAATPLQHAGVLALSWPDSYYADLATHYAERRKRLLSHLTSAGLKPHIPQGAYYVMTDVSSLGFEDDQLLCRHLIDKIGVAAVPGSSFFSRSKGGCHLIRFCFCKKYETLDLAGQLLYEGFRASKRP
jgi:aminotransferase